MFAQTIVCPADAPANVKLAAKEIRRYVWLYTGELLVMLNDQTDLSDRTDRTDRTDRIRLVVDGSLGPQQYRLKSAGGSLTISSGKLGWPATAPRLNQTVVVTD